MIIRSDITEAAPNDIKRISYGMPIFFLNGNLVHYAAMKNHLGFYPASNGIEAFLDKLIFVEKPTDRDFCKEWGYRKM